MTDPVRQAAVPFGRLGLPAQCSRLRFKAPDDIVQPRHIGFGGAQADLGFAPAHGKASNPGGFFQQLAALGRFGGDDGADAALANNCGAVRAGG